jgi:hypothetical protein
MEGNAAPNIWLQEMQKGNRPVRLSPLTGLIRVNQYIESLRKLLSQG